jgi:L-fuculose-phosphate aldolase
MNENEAKELICEIGSRVYKNGYVVANNGNFSIKLSEDEYLTTPTGVSKGYMTPSMICKVNLKGEKLSGSMNPSSEVKIHLKVYEECPDVNAVVHTHPPYTTIFAIAHIPLDKYILPEAVLGLGAVPLVPYQTPSTQALADGLTPYLPRFNTFLLENHGALTVGPDLMTAYFKTEELEYYSRIVYLLMSMGNNKINELPREKIDEILKLFTGSGRFMHPGYVKF